MDNVIHILSKAQDLSFVLYLAQTILWLAAFYMLYQMYRLRFLKWLLWGEIVELLGWINELREHIVGRPDVSMMTVEDAINADQTGYAIRLFLSVVPQFLFLIGIVMAVLWIQARFREFLLQSSPRPPPDSSSS